MRRKSYKDDNSYLFMNGKRGQIAIFVIIALVIIAVVLVVLLYPKLPITQKAEFTPEGYLRTCIEPSIKENLNKIADQGGYINPEGYLEYKGDKIKYLCYTAENYKTCIVQQPLIKENVEIELGKLIAGRTEECLQGLKEEYENRGFDVSLGKSRSEVSINPGEIRVKFIAPITATKDLAQRFEQFDIKINSQIYDLLLTATSIIDYESALGDSETTLYMRYYPNLKIEKTKLSDGSKVYKLSDVSTDERFRFASRSLSWPPGYGF